LIQPIEYASKRFPWAFYIVKWIVICFCIGLLAGSASALFLESLEWIGDYRGSNTWLLFLLPIGGFLVGVFYHYWGKGIESGNNLLIENIHEPIKPRIPIKMAPMVLLGTLLTHLVGGSAGREGTAIQMSGSLSDQLTRIFYLTTEDRKVILLASIAAGFSSVFGTPLAGAIFALEICVIGKIRYQALIPVLFAALIANYITTDFWSVQHTLYHIDLIPHLTGTFFLYSIVAGICFGLTSLLFIKTMEWISKLFKTLFSYPPMRPFVGGIVLSVIFLILLYSFNNTKFIGLGVAGILESFEQPAHSYDFLLKLFLTALTLSCGFKGGEVTPLFFIGAALGSALSIILPIPTALLAGMGFVAVFAGATNTPIACIFMGIELFGSACGVYVAIACAIAYICSGHVSIYTSQIVGQAKSEELKKDEKAMLTHL
jgi:H+/Cl- antiporter ClcA